MSSFGMVPSNLHHIVNLCIIHILAMWFKLEDIKHINSSRINRILSNAKIEDEFIIFNFCIWQNPIYTTGMDVFNFKGILNLRLFKNSSSFETYLRAIFEAYFRVTFCENSLLAKSPRKGFYLLRF